MKVKQKDQAYLRKLYRAKQWDLFHTNLKTLMPHSLLKKDTSGRTWKIIF